MITLYRTADDPTGQEIQEGLRDLCLAHDVVLVTAAGPGLGGLPEGASPPALVDEGRVYQDRGAMLARLEELKGIREIWYKYGSDACYCDEDGNIE